MTITVEGFQEELMKCQDECDIDSLCLRWLRGMSHDHGKAGEHAEKLLEVVGEMLDIYA
jgi:hypothetical protein